VGKIIHTGTVSNKQYVVHQSIYNKIDEVAIKIFGNTFQNISQNNEIKTLIESKELNQNIVKILKIQDNFIITEPISPRVLCYYLVDYPGDIPVDIQLLIAIGISNGLSFLHNRNICHENLSSYNIHIDDMMNIKITDYGFANVPTRWSSPECHLGNKYDPNSDIYSFGLILWQLSTKLTPYPDEIDDRVIQHYILEGIKNLIPNECLYSEIIYKCWNKPEMRPTANAINEHFVEMRSKTGILNRYMMSVKNMCNNIGHALVCC
jgi:serine/threonine protein kinase